MRIYPKRLLSIEDLEREKKLLKKESESMDIDALLSLDGILGKKQKGKEKEEGSSLLDFLPISNPLVGQLVKLLQRKLTKSMSGNEDAEYAPRTEKKKKGKSTLKAVAFEFIGGYLKWKAIELSYKGIRHLIKKRKEKKTTEE